MDFSVETTDFAIKKIIEFTEMTGFDIKETNTADQERIKPKQSEHYELANDKLSIELAPLSWNMIRCEV